MKKKILFPMVIILSVILFMTNLGSAADAPKEILIGCNTPVTGMFAGFGQGVWGVQAAVDDLNNLGGVYVKEYGKKIPMKLVVVDNESDPGKSATLAEELILRHQSLVTTRC